MACASVSIQQIGRFSARHVIVDRPDRSAHTVVDIAHRYVADCPADQHDAVGVQARHHVRFVGSPLAQGRLGQPSVVERLSQSLPASVLVACRPVNRGSWLREPLMEDCDGLRRHYREPEPVKWRVAQREKFLGRGMVLARKTDLECLDALQSRRMAEGLLVYSEVYALQATFLGAVTRDGCGLRLHKVL